MKSRLTKSIFLGIIGAAVASGSFALIAPENLSESKKEQLAIPTVMAKSAQNVVTPPIINPEQIDSFGKVATTPEAKFKLHNHAIKPGESLGVIFSKLGINAATLNQIITANETGKQFANLTSGKTLQFKTNIEGELEQLIYQKNAFNTLRATRNDDNFNVDLINKKIEREIVSAHVNIQNSLFLDAKNAGIPNKMIMQLADLFAWDIDFALNIRNGDQFTVLYENLLVDGKEFDTGDIIAAEFINQGNTFTAVRYKTTDGKTSYYTPEGKSVRKTFLRTPVAFTRISSRFNLKRKHPVLNRIRAHKGVDYAAKTGTPVKATGDGKIIYRGRKGGYGRVVILQHGQSYSTLYAHLSNYRRGQRSGQIVKQGQIIGYVGSSGLATGPHLHYEFRVGGRHRNPLTVKLPHAVPIKKQLLANFKQQTQPLLAQLNTAKVTLLARNEQL